MVDESLTEKYEQLYNSLRGIIRESESRVLSANPDSLLIDNVNFFVKSYMISICTYLESFLQDLAYGYAGEVSARVKSADLPLNYFIWKMSKDHKEKDLRFSNIDLSVTKKEISDTISANPYRTIVAFRYLGVNLLSAPEFNSNKSVVEAVVSKRNNIVHHNDRAADISFSDLVSYVDIFIVYMRAVYKAVDSKRKEAS
ncbi:hypothetical protein SAMN04487857_111127 [Pseudomonas sp. ok272]|uniref:HEPN domain-containing protein n=1 Tax=unclassified Pseudomonas TaxID=196821 RepID=UPI0008D448EF|nr:MULTISPECIES: HEPN domain-containing protein [unclassified Pseudomonas]SEN19238.1 hypothetical protein SAMN04487857_111127 [Pseudomonas sp. ok272]SFN11303.1 hypothetical protein SAMN04487858_112127 [Pseudomonas sp. ok602]